RLLLQFRVTTFSRHSALLLWSLRAVDRPFLRFVLLPNSTIRPLRAEATQADDAAQEVLVRRRRGPNVGMSVPRHSPHLPGNNQCSEEDAHAEPGRMQTPRSCIRQDSRRDVRGW